jgi:hypothetical protein
MSSLSSKTSVYSHSSSAKSKFIWRFPPSKFLNLPSCTSKRFDIQSLNIDDELIQRQQLSILIYELALHLNVYVILFSINNCFIFILSRSFTCIYTGVVYMHRFFMLHPFQQYLKEV